MNKLYQALEICLTDIEQGADIDSVLMRYPNLADELRPILEASLKAREMAVPAPSPEVVRRNRAKLLQRAAEMRERKTAATSRRTWSVPLRRAFVTLMVIIILFASGTGLVRAASNTLPGDNLYTVKRTWEDVLVFFTFNADKRAALEFDHENERLDEVNDLLAEGRSAGVDFAGYVTRQTGNEWRVSGITVFISPQTDFPAQQVQIGAAVRVKGRAQGSGVAATVIELLPPNTKLPEVQDNELEFEGETEKGSNPQVQQSPGLRSEVEETTVPPPKTPIPTVEPAYVSVNGTISSVENNFIVINGVVIDTSDAVINGFPSVGTVAAIEGYYDTNGIFIATSIQFQNVDFIEEGGSKPGDGSVDANNNNSNDNGNSHDGCNGNENCNENDNHNSNHN
jgi:hypothetical protein